VHRPPTTTPAPPPRRHPNNIINIRIINIRADGRTNVSQVGSAGVIDKTLNPPTLKQSVGEEIAEPLGADGQMRERISSRCTLFEPRTGAGDDRPR
jgi:hypothetical protein